MHAVLTLKLFEYGYKANDVYVYILAVFKECKFNDCKSLNYTHGCDPFAADFAQDIIFHDWYICTPFTCGISYHNCFINHETCLLNILEETHSINSVSKLWHNEFWYHNIILWFVIWNPNLRQLMIWDFGTSNVHGITMVMNSIKCTL